MECLDDNAVSAFIGRTLPEAERQRVIDHLSSCDACLEITCAAATTDAREAERKPAPPRPP